MTTPTRCASPFTSRSLEAKPGRCSGQTCVRGRRVTAAMLAREFFCGISVAVVASIYHVADFAVEDAIRWAMCPHCQLEERRRLDPEKFARRSAAARKGWEGRRT